jgi:hypothetical protein
MLFVIWTVSAYECQTDNMVTLTPKWVDCLTKTVQSTAKAETTHTTAFPSVGFLANFPSSFWMHQGSKNDGRELMESEYLSPGLGFRCR